MPKAWAGPWPAPLDWGAVESRGAPGIPRGDGDSLPPTMGHGDIHEATRPWSPGWPRGRLQLTGVKRQVGPNGTQWHLLAPDGPQWEPVGSNGTQWDPVGPGSPAAEGGWPGTIPRPLS